MFFIFSFFVVFNQVVVFSTGQDILTSSSTFKAPQECSHQQQCNARVIHPLSKKNGCAVFLQLIVILLKNGVLYPLFNYIERIKH